MRRFFIDPSETIKPIPVIKGSDKKHIINVLRLKPGDKIGLFDGNGHHFIALIKAFTSKGVELSLLKKKDSLVESNIYITVAQAFLKDRKMDPLVRQLTELGVNKWIPFIAHRSVARPNEKKTGKRMERWIKITREATKQCHRGYCIKISRVKQYLDIINSGNQYARKILFWENASNPLTFPMQKSLKNKKEILIVMGPEGGFTSDEIELARSYNFEIAGLGPRILKSDTATIASVTLIQFLYGDMGRASIKSVDDNDGVK